MIWGQVERVRAQMMAWLSVNVVVPSAVFLAYIVADAEFLSAPEWRLEGVSHRYYVDNRAGLVGRVAGEAPGQWRLR
ncbi:hypothetical protein [Pseudooceanicola sp. HF7]|uniref:hypothetical protein n=1 Tax=Pseudooceanicola sp. HF7 TaxID=2721560 RepID=UPI00142F9AB6|nr:hypothetical protein [Pseudooceanicola sp. HF7]NIZ09807.1 hypothetical protein [Pseudooceanicola sp. HF7]